MYQRIVNQLLEFFPGVGATELLKLAYAARDNKGVSLAALKKIHEDLPAKVEELAFGQNPAMEAKVQHLRELGQTDHHFYIGFSCYQNPDKRDMLVKSWFCYALPQKNVVALG